MPSNPTFLQLKQENPIKPLYLWNTITYINTFTKGYDHLPPCTKNHQCIHRTPSAELIKTEIIVKDTPISVIRIDKTDFISLTDLAKYQNSSDPSFTVKNWLRRVSTIDYIGLWEQLHNSNFNLVEFDQIKTEYGKNSFAMSPTQWIKRTNSIGIIAKGGRYSIGTFAHPDIAFEFASWLSPEFKLYLITEFERLKINEAYQNKIE